MINFLILHLVLWMVECAQKRYAGVRIYQYPGPSEENTDSDESVLSDSIMPKHIIDTSDKRLFIAIHAVNCPDFLETLKYVGQFYVDFGSFEEIKRYDFYRVKDNTNILEHTYKIMIMMKNPGIYGPSYQIESSGFRLVFMEIPFVESISLEYFKKAKDIFKIKDEKIINKMALLWLGKPVLSVNHMFMNLYGHRSFYLGMGSFYPVMDYHLLFPSHNPAERSISYLL